jgi:hypothetical protein
MHTFVRGHAGGLVQGGLRVASVLLRRVGVHLGRVETMMTLIVRRILLLLVLRRVLLLLLLVVRRVLLLLVILWRMTRALLRGARGHLVVVVKVALIAYLVVDFAIALGLQCLRSEENGLNLRVADLIPGAGAEGRVISRKRDTNRRQDALILQGIKLVHRLDYSLATPDVWSPRLVKALPAHP